MLLSSLCSLHKLGKKGISKSRKFQELPAVIEMYVSSIWVLINLLVGWNFTPLYNNPCLNVLSSKIDCLISGMFINNPGIYFSGGSTIYMLDIQHRDRNDYWFHQLLRFVASFLLCLMKLRTFKLLPSTKRPICGVCVCLCVCLCVCVYQMKYFSIYSIIFPRCI